MQGKGEVRGGDGKQGRSEGCGARMQLRDTRRGTGRGVVMMLLVPAEEVSGVRAGRRRRTGELQLARGGEGEGDLARPRASEGKGVADGEAR